MRRVALLVAPLLALVLVAGCDSDSDKSDSTASAREGAKGDTSAPCAVGSWEADIDAMVEALGLGAEPDGGDFTADGEFGFDLSQGGTVDGRWAMTGVLSDSTREVQAEFDTTFTGTWSGSDSDLELVLAGGEGTMTRTVDGGQPTTQDASDLFDGEVWTATCSASTMVVTMPSSDGDDKITFTRR